MNTKEIPLTENNNNYRLIKQTLEKELSNKGYQVTITRNKWIINFKGSQCVITKKSAWNTACIEINEKKEKIEISSIMNNARLDSIFRKQFGLIGMLFLEPF